MNEAELLSISKHLIRRGPDSEGSWVSLDRRIGLAHRRLSIIDLSDSGHQPMGTFNGEIQLVFNGEIYNYRELKNDLEARGISFNSDSDTEVILRLYEFYGEQFITKLRGMFGLVIWDSRSRTLLAVRDPLGIKPLYYSDDGKCIRIASQVKALLKGDVDKSPNPAGYVSFFTWGHVSDPHTLYNGIRSLPAGHILKITERGSVKLRSYATLNDFIVGNNERPQDLKDLRGIMLDSMKHHLIADTPVSLFLSSGIDSATLLGIASEVSKERVNTITLGFEEYVGTELDEVPLAEYLAKYYKSNHQTIRISRKFFLAQSDSIFEAMDQPSIDGVNVYLVSLAAKQAGYKVAISGLGGDELFQGYSGFREIERTVKYLRWAGASSTIGKVFRKLSEPFIKTRFSPKYASLLEYGHSVPTCYLLRRSLHLPWELGDIMDREFLAKGIKKLDIENTLHDSVRGIDATNKQISQLEMSYYMRNQLLRDADWAGMYHSLEIRTPLVDSVLLERTVNLAYPDLLAKQDLANTPIPSLPDEIKNRKKTGFSIPVGDWLAASVDGAKGKGLRNWSRYVASRYEPGHKDIFVSIALS